MNTIMILINEKYFLRSQNIFTYYIEAMSLLFITGKCQTSNKYDFVNKRRI